MKYLAALILCFAFTINSVLAVGYSTGGGGDLSTSSFTGTLPVDKGGTGNTYGALPGGSATQLVTTNNYQILTSTSPFIVIDDAAVTNVYLPLISTSIGKIIVVVSKSGTTMTVKLHTSDGATTRSTLAQWDTYTVMFYNNGATWLPLMKTSSSADGTRPYFNSGFIVEAGGIINTGDFSQTGGNLKINNGTKLSVASERAGQCTLVTGAVTVANTTVTANTQVRYCRVSGTAANTGVITVTRVADTSFTLTSSNGADDSVYEWFLVEKF